MKKVELRMNEYQKYEIIKKLIDYEGIKKPAALNMQWVPRTIAALTAVTRKWI